MGAGLTAGTVVAGYLAGEQVLAYWLFAGAAAASCLAFVALNREPSSEAQPHGPMQWAYFLKSFWISPRDHPDFAWAFARRFAIYMVIRRWRPICSTYCATISGWRMARRTSPSPIWRCRPCCVWPRPRSCQRRKPFVIVGSLIMGAAMVAPLAAPSMAGMWVYPGMIGIGYGMKNFSVVS